MSGSRFSQIKIYMGKCFRLFLSERRWMSFVSAVIIMIIISSVTSEDMFIEYRDTKNGAFAIISACIWIGLFNSIQSICRERPIIKREHRTGLHISSYIVAHVLYELFLCVIESLIITVAVLLKNSDHLPEEGLIFSAPVDLYLVFLSVTFSADMIALLISSIVKNENTAMTVMPFILIIQLVMSGAVFDLSGTPEVISKFTICKWGLNGLCAVANTTDSVKAGYDFLELTGADPETGNLFLILAILASFSVVYILLSILSLEGIDRDKR